MIGNYLISLYIFLMRISEKGMKKVREGGRERPFLSPLEYQIGSGLVEQF